VTLQDLTRELIALRKKPGTEERFKSYPKLLQGFTEALAACEDVATLREVIALDSNYFLLAGFRQNVLKKWMSLERSAEVLRLYAMQLMLFGDVDDYGNADTNTDAQVTALEEEAERLENER
jgi:hypothetical protein